MHTRALARTLRAVSVGLGAIVLAIRAAAIISIDLTGSWTIFIDGTPFPATISQSGGDLTIQVDSMTLTGTIDQFFGTFSVYTPANPLYGLQELDGAATADGNSIHGSALVGCIACPAWDPLCGCPDAVSKPMRACRTDGGAECCGDGIVDPNEQCDDGPGSGVTCCTSDCQFAPATQSCRLAFFQCDVQENCTGNSDACPANQQAAAGTPCSDDGNLCTGDACNGAGACVHLPEITTPCGQPTASAAAKIRIVNRDNADGDSLAFRWKKGPETPTDDFGDPTTSTAYSLCVYDETGGPGTATLKLQADIPAGGTCTGGPCWDATSKGFTYYNPDTTPDGVKRLRLVTGEDGKAKLAVGGRGANLALPSFPYAPKITVQLRASNGGCWGASFSTPSTNSDGKLKAKSD